MLKSIKYFLSFEVFRKNNQLFSGMVSEEEADVRQVSGSDGAATPRCSTDESLRATDLTPLCLVFQALLQGRGQPPALAVFVPVTDEQRLICSSRAWSGWTCI